MKLRGGGQGIRPDGRGACSQYKGEGSPGAALGKKRTCGNKGDLGNRTARQNVSDVIQFFTKDDTEKI